MTIFLGAVLVGAAVLLYVVQPVFTGERAPLAELDEEFTEAEARRHLTLIALRDAEYDYATGKVDEADYRSLRDDLAREALAALGEVRRSRAAEDLAGGEGAEAAAADDLEQEIETYRTALRAGTLCPGCGTANVAEALYCAKCGRDLETGRGRSARSAGEE